MAPFSVVAGTSFVPFAVADANGAVPAETDAFLKHLTLNGRSPYTVRSYALALADFHGWCTGRGLSLMSVVPADVQAYVGRDV